MTVADRAGDEHLADPKRKIEIEESGDDVVSSSRHTSSSYSPHRQRIVSISIFVSAREDPCPPETVAPTDHRPRSRSGNGARNDGHGGRLDNHRDRARIDHHCLENKLAVRAIANGVVAVV